MASLASRRPGDAAVVVISLFRGSPEAWFALVDQLPADPEPSFDTIRAAEAPREPRADARE